MLKIIDATVLFIKARCTPEKLTILTKHSKTFFSTMLYKILLTVSYNYPEILFKIDEHKGFKSRFCDMVSQCAKISVAFTCVLVNVQVELL